MQIRESFKYNNHGVKSSCDQYRNINGVRFECYESNEGEFESIRAKAKEMGLKVRIIKGELYREVK